MNMVTSSALLELAGDRISPDNNDSIHDIFKQTELDWTVQQTPVLTDVHGQVENALVNYRSDNKQVLGIVSESHYQIVNNVEAFSFIDDLRDFSIETVGMANKGKQVFVVGKSSQEFSITHGDNVQQYLTFIHGHTGKHGIQLIISPIRTFCTNQFNMLIKEATFRYSLKHTGDVEVKLKSVRKALNNNTEYMMQLCKRLRDLTTQKLSMQIDEFLERLIEDRSLSTKGLNRIDDIRYTIKDLYYNKNDNQNYIGTKFGMLNAVADYVSHARIKQHDIYSNANAFITTIQHNDLLDKAYTLLAA